MQTDVLIIGNSAAGLSAAETIRKYDFDKKITIVSKESGPAYSRVLLPYVLRGKLDYDNLFIRDGNYYIENNFYYIEGLIVSVNTESKTAVCESSEIIKYDSLLIATGSNPVKPPIPGIESEGVYHMWTKDDLDHLMPHFNKDKRVVVIGSGFVSLQAAWSAVCKGLKVTVIELADRIMPSVIDNKGAEILTGKIKECGVDLRIDTLTLAIKKRDDGTFVIDLKDQSSIEADFIIVGTGVKPNTSFLEETDIDIDRGICVNRYMQTSVDDVYAAGDVAGGPTAFGDQHQIHALWPTAIEMGKVAGMNILGKQFVYEGSLNMNVTQMYDMTVASMGQFTDNLDCDEHLMPESSGMGYLKICAKDDQIIGACLIGKTSAMKIFGMLRPVIRLNKKLKVDITRLESDLQKLTYGVAH
ncbi:NAD(P)/FAD-dependent oxidoreductase [Endozoicomonas sp. OPT23]|uniref:NAD(P)/FAD-dependent oxidoreductase n=1 Tax=Endozoicomonas sp. OPT23 TaxID=2072845 RepID=UPI00129AC58F|nr:FAD-dependent oxidoreductase [Endozoicomonas sp. OPT23]MRI34432.1 NAD(P)/FAD-dependent oxidoreductase [Endozoicomonas sp. OPT23]